MDERTGFAGNHPGYAEITAFTCCGVAPFNIFC